MKTIIILIALFALIGCSSQSKEGPKKSPPQQPEKISPPTIGIKEKLLDAHNQERIFRKLKPLTLDKKLCDYAQKHAQKMAKKNSLYHSSMSDLIKVNEDSSLVGENIAWGQETEKLVVEAWMWSPMHRWNILGTSYKRVGLGVEEDENGRPYWCVVFSD
jgi:uncharacterized protein YkwD